MYLGLGASEVEGPHCMSLGQLVSLCLPPPPHFLPLQPFLSHQPSLLMVWLQGTDLRFGARKLN